MLKKRSERFAKEVRRLEKSGDFPLLETANRSHRDECEEILALLDRPERKQSSRGK